MHIQQMQTNKLIVGRDLNGYQVRRGVIISIKTIINKMVLLHISKI